MKQFIITMLMAIGFVLGMNAQDISLTQVQTLSSHPYFALDKDGNLHLANYTRNDDNTVTFYIYSKDLSIAHSFQSVQFDSYYETSEVEKRESIETLEDGLLPDEVDILLSQNLFNKDDEWEYVLRRYTYNKTSDKRTIEYTIYNESGAKYNLPESEGYPDRCLAYGSNQYVGYYFSIDMNDSYYVYYSAQGTNSAHAPELNENKISVLPNPVRSGQAFTVSFTNAMTDTCIFSILDLNGVSIYSSDIQAGETAKTVPGNTLSPGMYLYTVSSADGLVQSGKIIVQ